MSEEDWDKSIALNLKSAFLCCRAVGKVMVNLEKGSIVNHVLYGRFWTLPIGRQLRCSQGRSEKPHREFSCGTRTYNVRVNALAPGPVETPTIAEYYKEHPEIKEQRLKAIPLRRIASPEDIANVALFLASDASGYVSGQTILINGALATFVTPEMIEELKKRF